MTAERAGGDGQGTRANLVEVKDLVHVYPGGTLALDRVSLSIGTHEMIAIIGQNGSGKTTLVKHFNGLLRPTHGSVLVNGRDTRPLRTAQLAAFVGYVFQNPNHQLFCPTVREEIAFGLRNLGLASTDIKSKVEETIESFGLQPYVDLHPYTLSLGVRKLVAIASIYVMGPQVVILDEPTTGQDHKSNALLSQRIQIMFQTGRSILFVTHDMRFVAEHAQRVVVMSKAKIIFDGTPRQLFVRDDVLKAAKLRPPQITVLGQQLADCGVPPDILTVEQMAGIIEERLAA